MGSFYHPGGQKTAFVYDLFADGSRLFAILNAGRGKTAAS